MKLIRNILLGIGVVLMTVFYTLLSVVKTPARLLRYRKSDFAADTGAAYEGGITESPVYLLYNGLRQQGIPVEAVAHPKHPMDAHLVWKNTLLIHEIDRLAFRGGIWVIGPGSPVWKEGLELKTAIAEVLDDVFDDCPGRGFDDALILMDRSGIAPDAMEQAEAASFLLLYSTPGERLQKLTDYCKTH